MKPRFPKILKEIEKKDLNYLKTQSETIKNIVDWTDTKEAEVFLNKGVLDKTLYAEHSLFRAYSNSIKDEIRPIQLINRDNFLNPSKKEEKLFKDAKIPNKEMTNQIKFSEKTLDILFSNNGIWSKKSLFYECMDNIGYIDKYCEYDVNTGRIYEIPLSKLHSASHNNPFYIREMLFNSLKEGDLSKLEILARSALELQEFIKNRFDILIV